MSKNKYFQQPETGVTMDMDMRQVFIYSAKEDENKLPALAEQIRDPRNGTKCLVKWIASSASLDANDLEIHLRNSQVAIILVTKKLLNRITCE